MCIGVPMQVVAVADGVAVCERRGERARLDAMLLAAVAPGDYVLAFQGRALRVLDAAEAARTNDALDALDAVMRGEADAGGHFADLVGREPELPAHLRGGS